MNEVVGPEAWTSCLLTGELKPFEVQLSDLQNFTIQRLFRARNNSHGGTNCALSVDCGCVGVSVLCIRLLGRLWYAQHPPFVHSILRGTTLKVLELQRLRSELVAVCVCVCVCVCFRWLRHYIDVHSSLLALMQSI